MTSSYKKTPVSFTGTWKIAGPEYYEPEKGWKTCDEYPFNITAWEFTETRKKEFPDGTVEYTGRLKEFSTDGHAKYTEYHYFTTDCELFIDRSYDDENGYGEIFVNDRYRVVPSASGTYLLYDLEDAEKDSDSYNCRIRMMRPTITSR